MKWPLQWIVIRHKTLDDCFEWKLSQEVYLSRSKDIVGKQIETSVDLNNIEQLKECKELISESFNCIN